MKGLELLQQHGVSFNVLTTVHAANAAYGQKVYRFLRDEVGAQFIQLIPIVERDNATGFQEGTEVTKRSVTGKQYGQFMIEVFDEWVYQDVGRVYVQLFDVSLAAWLGERPGLCVFEETCGKALALEHTGDVYSCDHYVEPAHHLGNLVELPLVDMVVSDQQLAFGEAKRTTLPRYCRACEVRFVCNGGCPKDRVLTTPDGEAGLNYLCEGYKTFFTYVDPYMKFMANEIRFQRAPANIMPSLRQRDLKIKEQLNKLSRNDLCPCGSGKKVKHCHGSRL